MACLKLLLNEKLGLSALYPNNNTLNEYSCCVTSEYSRSRKGIFTGQIHGKVWSQKSHQTGHNEQYFTCQTKLQQTMLWACVRYSSWQVFLELMTER